MTNQTEEINLNDFEKFMVADYAPLNQTYRLTITGASRATFFDRKENVEKPCPALHFEETRKQLKMAGSEVRHQLARMHGASSAGWIGKPIGVRVIEKKIAGKLQRVFEIVDAPAKPKESPAKSEPSATNEPAPTKPLPTELDPTENKNW